MATYYVDDGGSATSPYDTWAKAATSLSALDDAITFASGDIIYIGHNHVCQFTHSTNRVFSGPTSNPPCLIISATQGSSPPTYQPSTTKQVDVTEGAYNITFDGAFGLYGISIATGNVLTLAGSDLDESIYAEDCNFMLAANQILGCGSATKTTLINCTIDLSADGTTNRTAAIFFANNGSIVDIRDISFVSAGYRTGAIFNQSGGRATWNVSGCDFSGFDSSCEIVDSATESVYTFNNCLLGATFTPTTAIARSAFFCSLYNCGSSDEPTSLYLLNDFGSIISTSSIYRTSGAEIETIAAALLVTTSARCSEASPVYSPWIYGEVASTGSKTFTVYITNDTADFTDAEVWLEVEYLGTADEANTTLVSDHRTITTTAANQTDDTTSVWVGLNNSGQGLADYMQSLSVTATVGETGQYRARVCVGVASIAGSRYFYIDPKVTVS
jgi:hypothetical protein